MHEERVRYGIIGGSGLYAMAGLEDVEQVEVATPFGPPSDSVAVGRLSGRRVAFLARHGKQHRLLPSEINYRANLFALKSLGVERVVSVSAVGSMREGIHPRDIVLVDQFIDRTSGRASTFFGDGIVAHIGFADPVCRDLRAIVADAARDQGTQVHDGGTYLCMEGPAFSTRAESRLYRSWEVDVIGMTNLQEAKLAREAEICYATMALVTDYDCWHEEEEDVSVGELLENLKANSRLAAEVLRKVLSRLPEAARGCGCERALEHAIITPAKAVPEPVRRRLAPIVGKYLRG